MSSVAIPRPGEVDEDLVYPGQSGFDHGRSKVRVGNKWQNTRSESLMAFLKQVLIQILDRPHARYLHAFGGFQSIEAGYRENGLQKP